MLLQPLGLLQSPGLTKVPRLRPRFFSDRHAECMLGGGHPCIDALHGAVAASQPPAADDVKRLLTKVNNADIYIWPPLHFLQVPNLPGVDAPSLLDGRTPEDNRK